MSSYEDRPPDPSSGPAEVPADPDAFPAQGPDSLAGIGQRILARILDALVLAVPAAALLLPQVSIDGDELSVDVPLWVTVALFAMGFAYEVALVAWRGQTVGKIALRIRVARFTDGKVPAPSQAAIRHVLPAVIGVTPYVSILALVVYVSAAWDPMKRGWHDKAAGTVVVRC
ncbi:hypothetical protein BH20ACT2_BH20ACT2_08780 [soil metagenome]